jgi:tryptophanase
MAGRDPVTGSQRRARMELFRLAVPRRVYTDNHMEFVAQALAEVYGQREEIAGVRFDKESKVLPHFTSTFQGAARKQVLQQP